MEDGPAEPRTSGGSTLDAPRKTLRETLLCARVAKKSPARRGRRKKSQPRPAEWVYHGSVSIQEWVPAPRVRYVVLAGRVPVSFPPDAWLQRPPSPSVPLHRPPDPGSREADRRKRAEAVGDPPSDGHPRPRGPEVRRPDALDRSLPSRDDGGPESPRGRCRLDAVVHHDAPEPALRRIRALAVPPPEGRWLCADRQAPCDLVSE